ncbi:MAG: hypothetical protein JWN08_1016 [Frankiales bacterium]|nr:hypothetical protein [Frankiales bacterium]
MPVPLRRRLLPLATVSLAAATLIGGHAAIAAPPISATAPDLALVASPFVLEETTIAQIQAALAAQRVTCVQLVDGYLARIAAYEDAGPALNALITVAANARAQAAALDAAYRARRGPVGPLHCVPMVLKDNIDTNDMQTTAGSRTLAGSTPTRDATITSKLRTAGVIVLAKGNLDEWAHGGMAGYSSVNGQTRNPYDLSRSPSGSSGGPAAAVAANFAVAGVGSDTLGSIRGPVDAQSLAGIKPTVGLVSGAGVVPFSLTFDVAGPLTRTVADSAAILDVIAGVDPEDPRTSVAAGKVSDYTAALRTTALQGVRVGVLRNYVTGGNVPVVAEAITTMRNLGAEVVELQAPAADITRIQSDVYTPVSQTDFKAQLGDYLRARRPAAAVQSHADVLAASSQPGFGIAPSVLARLQAESQRGPVDDPAIQTLAATGTAAMRDVVDSLLQDNDVDVLLHPTSTASGIASLSGYPAALVPGGTNASGVSVGLALQGTAFTEARLLAYAYAYEQAARARTLPALTPPLTAATPTATMSPSATPTVTIAPDGACATRPAVTLERSTIVATGSAGVTVTAPASATVDLLAYTRPSSTFRVVRTGTTGPDGTLVLPALRPSANTRLYARVRGCAANPAADSQVLDVRTALSLTATRTGPRTYVFAGRALPARAGGLVVSLYRVTPEGRQVLTSQTRAGTDGAWSLQRTFTGTGRFGFVVRTGQDLTNAPGSSNVRSTLVF